MTRSFSAAAGKCRSKLRDIIDQFQLIQPAAEYPDFWDYAESPNIVTAAQTLGVDPMDMGLLLQPILEAEGHSMLTVTYTVLVATYIAHTAKIDDPLSANTHNRTTAIRQALISMISEPTDTVDIGCVLSLLDELGRELASTLSANEWVTGFQPDECLLAVFKHHCGIDDSQFPENPRDRAALLERMKTALSYPNFSIPPTVGYPTLRIIQR